MSQPFFSICIPVYNGAATLKATIQSVLQQDFASFELCVVDNASTDDTPTILAHFRDSRLRVHRNSQVVPAHENWSLSIEMAKGEWTKLICADDLLLPGALSRIANEIQNNPGVRVICGSRNVIDEFGRQVRGPRQLVSESENMNIQQFRRRIMRVGSNPIGEAVCWTWDSTLTHQVGRFSPKWQYFIDVDYWLRLCTCSEVLLTRDHIGSFRVSRTSWTSSLGIRTISESLRFLWTHPQMGSQPMIYKLLGTASAITRGLARSTFLWTVQHRR